MAERDLIEQLEQVLEGKASPGPEVAELVRIASDVRYLPDEKFRARLKGELMITITKTNWIPEGFHSVTPYLHPQAAPELIDFMKRAFGAEELGRYPRPDGSIMHAQVRIGDSILEMGEPPGEHKPQPVPLHMYVEDADAVYRQAIAAGGKSIYEPVDQEYGDREGGVIDPSGNHWYIATHKGARYIPEGLHTVTQGLAVANAPVVLEFLKNAFAAEEAFVFRSPDGTIVHAKIKIGDTIVEMSEVHGPFPAMPAALHLYVEDVDAVYKAAVAAGGKSLSAPQDQPYGERSGGVADPAGNLWYIASRL